MAERMKVKENVYFPYRFRATTTLRHENEQNS